MDNGMNKPAHKPAPHAVRHQGYWTATGNQNLADLDDHALMRQTGVGNQAAFALLVKRHLPGLIAVARRYTGSGAEAEDIAQEALTRLWIKAPGWYQQGPATRPTAQPKSWLYQVVVHLCIDRHRRTRLMVQGADDDAVADMADERPNAEKMLEDQALAKTVQAALDRLPERQKTVLVLCFFEQMRNTEVADILEISVGAVESLLVRARKQLRTELAGLAHAVIGGKNA